MSKTAEIEMAERAVKLEARCESLAALAETAAGEILALLGNEAMTGEQREAEAASMARGLLGAVTEESARWTA
jgi:hypothetical protein